MLMRFIELGTPKVLAELHLYGTDGSHSVLATHAKTTVTFDASTYYRPDDNSGCAWYYYPMENTDASKAPVGTPLSTTRSESRQPLEASLWKPAMPQASFEYPLVGKPTAALVVAHQTNPVIKSRGNGSFFVDFGRNLQGTLQLDLQLASGVAGPRVQLTLGEELSSADRRPSYKGQYGPRHRSSGVLSRAIVLRTFRFLAKLRKKKNSISAP